MEKKNEQGSSVPLLTLIIVTFSIIATAIAVFLFGKYREGYGIREEDILFLLPMTVTTDALGGMLGARRLSSFRIAQTTRYLAAVLVFPAFFMSAIPAVHFGGFLFFVALIIELSILEEYPRNLAMAVFFVLSVLLVQNRILGRGNITPNFAASQNLFFGISGFGIAILTCRMVFFREKVVDLKQRNDTLEQKVADLARTNTRYQAVALTADEKGRSTERNRISRDIHDIVGYTLTNNIMLMEKAMDMMRENPLGVPKVIESARTNAQEGLVRVRQALYDLRKQDVDLPCGISAVQRLVQLYGNATGVQVDVNWANAPSVFLPAVDSTIYHLVQESLINSFRHGKANMVSLSCWREANVLKVYIRDNGKTVEPLVEGIGIQGMRERLGTVGGSLVVSKSEYGFLVKAEIPLEGEAQK